MLKSYYYYIMSSILTAITCEWHKRFFKSFRELNIKQISKTYKKVENNQNLKIDSNPIFT